MFYYVKKDFRIIATCSIRLHVYVTLVFRSSHLKISPGGGGIPRTPSPTPTPPAAHGLNSLRTP